MCVRSPRSPHAPRKVRPLPQLFGGMCQPLHTSLAANDRARVAGACGGTIEISRTRIFRPSKAASRGIPYRRHQCSISSQFWRISAVRTSISEGDGQRSQRVSVSPHSSIVVRVAKLRQQAQRQSGLAIMAVSFDPLSHVSEASTQLPSTIQRARCRSLSNASAFGWIWMQIRLRRR